MNVAGIGNQNNRTNFCGYKQLRQAGKLIPTDMQADESFLKKLASINLNQIADAKVVNGRSTLEMKDGSKVAASVPGVITQENLPADEGMYSWGTIKSENPQNKTIIGLIDAAMIHINDIALRFKSIQTDFKSDGLG